MSIKYNNDSNFDVDLKFGNKHEKKIGKLLGLKTEEIEVKTERDWWAKTGNICIEIERRGKPTGLSITKAKVWVHVLSKGDKQLLRLVIDVPVLKKLAEKFKDNWKMVGDRRETKAIMIPFNKIIYELTNDN
ncbi:MAG: hypothetical protein CMG84_13485 [Marinobacter sp.]|nr:hypothetical protein [Marinobacter sp.]